MLGSCRTPVVDMTTNLLRASADVGRIDQGCAELDIGQRLVGVLKQIVDQVVVRLPLRGDAPVVEQVFDGVERAARGSQQQGIRELVDEGRQIFSSRDAAHATGPNAVTWRASRG